MTNEKIIETIFFLEASRMLTSSQRNKLITAKVRKLSMMENFNYSKKAKKKLEGVNIEKKLMLKKYIEKYSLKKADINVNVIKSTKLQIFE